MAVEETIAWELRAENVGGIDEAELRFEPGVTVLAGRNASNRTSLLRAIMAAMGSDRGSLKADADAGNVVLELGDETVTRTFERRNGTVVTGGDPYLDDPSDIELAELFGFLLESNEARRAVARGDDLRDLIMRPVDTAAIESEIQQAMRDRDRIDDELDELDDLATSLPDLEQQRRDLTEEIEEVEAELAEKRAELEDLDREATEPDADVDEAMADLEATRTEFNRTRQRLETERSSVASLEDELEELRSTLKDLPDPAHGEDIEQRLAALRDRRSRLDDVVSELHSIVEFNESLLEGAENGLRDFLKGEETAPTDALLPEDAQEVVCWTCGSTVERSEIETAIDRLREVREETQAERSAIRSDIEELTDKQREQTERREERERLERQIERAESELEDRRERIETLETERDELSERVDQLESEVAAREAAQEDELLERNREVNELEFERDRLEAEREDVTAEIETIESRLSDRETLEADRAALTDRLQDLRERIDRTEREAVEAFNEHMASLLEVLEYENLERIWIERQTDRDPSRFDLTIVRATEDGTVYEDSVEHLSESEREVTGLVFALAGYLVHDVHETVPVMLLDSIEAIDSERIASVLEYFSTHASSIVVALLPADAAAVDDDYQYIREI